MDSILEDSDKEAYDRKYMKQKLTERFGDAIEFASRPGLATKLMFRSGNNDSSIALVDADCVDADCVDESVNGTPSVDDTLTVEDTLEPEEYPTYRVIRCGSSCSTLHCSCRRYGRGCSEDCGCSEACSNGARVGLQVQTLDE